MNKVVALFGGKRAADAFRKTVSGDPTGAPAWAQQMAIGNDVGLFGPESAVWEVHGSISTLVGGIRALLMQAAHPAALTGVAEHSQYDTDPLGRLERTTRWLTITTFGSTEAIEQEARRVNELHSHVKGEYPAKDGKPQPYSARDARHLLWVHCAFTDSFLKAHLALGYSIDQRYDTRCDSIHGRLARLDLRYQSSHLSIPQDRGSSNADRRCELQCPKAVLPCPCVAHRLTDC